MSDARLRDLERRWKQTGAVRDEAAWLQERLRAGELSLEQVRTAAFLGHEAACLALERPVPPPDPWPADFDLRARAEDPRVYLRAWCAAVHLFMLDPPPAELETRKPLWFQDLEYVEAHLAGSPRFEARDLIRSTAASGGLEGFSSLFPDPRQIVSQVRERLLAWALGARCRRSSEGPQAEHSWTPEP